MSIHTVSYSPEDNKGKIMTTENTTTATDPRNGDDWAAKIGASCYACLREMVAALECDYDRLEKLRDERDGFEFDEDANTAPDGPGYPNNVEAWKGENPDDAEELKELEEAAGDCKDRDDAETRIWEDPLSVQVRSDWEDSAESFTASEFQILLSTGGPATRIMGELDEHGEPSRAWLEVQDWFKPWTQYFPDTSGTDAMTTLAEMRDVLLTYARCFTFSN